LTFLVLVAAAPVVWSPRLAELRTAINRQPLMWARAAAVCAAVIVVVGALGSWRRSTQDFSSRALVGALALAALGEGFAVAGRSQTGAVLYAVAALLALAVAGSSLARGVAQPLHLRFELPLVAIVFVVNAFARFYLLGAYPYGIEGDEMKWNYSIVQYMMAGERQAWPAATFYGYAPLSFWYESLVFRLFSPSHLAARMVVASLSLAASIAFYFLAKRLTNSGVALITTFFLGVSIVDVSASRLSNVESQIKLWVVLAPLLAVLALDSGRIVAFALCGLSVAAGLLTYDTYHPMSAVVGGYLALRLILRFARSPSTWLRVLTSGAAFGLGVLPAVPTTLSGLNLRRGAYEGVWRYWHVEPPLGPEDALPFSRMLLANVSDLFTTIFVRQRWNDYLVNRPGPLLNVVLLPFLVLGLVWLLRHVGHRHNSLVLLWLVLALFPAALLIGAVWVRVLYPAQPVLYLLCAIGIWWTYRAVVRLVTAPAAAVLMTVVVVLVGAGNGYVYSREVMDFDDRRARRELVDFVADAVQPSHLTYLVHQPNRGDFIEVERPVAQFTVRGKVGIPRESEFSQHIVYADLLPRILESPGDGRDVVVITDSLARDLGASRMEVLAAMQRCLPGSRQTAGKFVASYFIPVAARAGSQCEVDTIASLTSPGSGARLPAGQPLSFAWSAPRQPEPPSVLRVERRNDRVQFVEAETFTGSDWQIDGRFTDGFSGTGFLLEGPRAGPARLPVAVAVADTYWVWVRTFRRVADDSRVYATVGSERAEIARADRERLSRWVWDRIGPYALSAGQVEIGFAKDFGTAPHISLFIDSVYLSRDPSFDPNQNSEWAVVLDTPELPRGSTSFAWTPAEAGVYRWRVQFRDGDRLIDRNGRVGAWSDYVHFAID
jgi:4-amino-4-deoxy-L-arabinose transferase-like glycosyltransferase